MGQGRPPREVLEKMSGDMSETSETGPADHDPRWRPTPTKIIVAILLLVGIIMPLLVSTYDSIEPRLFGFPFFYWYQLLWVFLAAGICGLCYVLLKRERDAYRRDHPSDREEATR